MVLRVFLYHYQTFLVLRAGYTINRINIRDEKCALAQQFKRLNQSVV